MSKRTGYFVAILACVLLASCKSTGPVKTFVKGDEVKYYDFNTSEQFEQGTYTTASLLARDGVYRIDIRSGDNELWWGQGGPTLGDVVIDVDTLQLSQRNENAFGVMCRVRGHVGQQLTLPEVTPEATANATSIATASATAQATSAATQASTAETTAEATTSASIAAQALAQMMAGATAESTAEATGAATQAAGTAEATNAASVAANPLAQELAAIPDAATAEATARATAESTALATTLEENSGDGYLFLIQGTGSFAIFRSRGRNLTPLVNWTTSDKVKVGPDTNHLRAVCVGNYLAFYANDAFLGDATDDAYTEGQVGLAASAANRLGVRIDFDNLSISAAKPG